MRLRLFTFLMMFLATMSGAVWGQEYDISEGDLSIVVSPSVVATHTITGTTEENSISVSGGGRADITLKDVSIDLSAKEKGAFKITGNTTVYLTLAGTDNLLRSDRHYAGIYVETGSTLVITKESGNTHLKVESVAYGKSGDGTNNVYAAGIGGGGGDTPIETWADPKQSPDFGTIRIEGGNIEAYSYTDGGLAHAHGAGIGGGNESHSGDIIIIGGTIKASCIDEEGINLNQRPVGAAIGGGYQGTVSSITILGGTINAQNAGNIDYSGQNIGNGYEYTGDSHPSIIFGKWDDSTTPTMTYETIDNTNFLDIHSNKTVANGTVTMPANTQMVLAADPTGCTLNAYKVVYNNNLPQGATGGEMPTTMAYGPSTSYTLATLSETTTTVNSYTYQLVITHWLNSSNAWVEAGSNQVIQSTTPSGLVEIPYGAAWVLKEASLEFNDKEGLIAPLNVYGPENASFTITDTNNETYSSLSEVGLQLDNRQLKKADSYSEVTAEKYTVLLNFTPKDQTGGPLQGIINITVKDTPDQTADLTISPAITTGNILTYNGTALNKNSQGEYDNNVAISIKNQAEQPVSLIHFDVEYSLTKEENSWSKDLINAGKYFVRISAKTNVFEGTQTTEEPIVEVKQATVSVKSVADATYAIGGAKPDYSKTKITFDGIVSMDEETILGLLSWTGTVNEESLSVAGTYKDAVEYTIIVADNDAANNYIFPEKAKGNLIVQNIGGEDNPITPGNPDEDDTEIIPGTEDDMDGWTWDSENNRYYRMYDGGPHPLNTISLKYKNSNGETAWETLSLDDNDVTYSPSEPWHVVENGYTATVTISESQYYSGTTSITLYIEPRPLGVHFNLDDYLLKAGQTYYAFNYADYESVGGMGGELGTEPPVVEGTITVASAPNAEGKYAVTFNGVKLGTSDDFRATDYLPTYYLNGEWITLDENGDGTFGDDEGEEGIEIVEESTGGSGSIITQRHQLYLADKDFDKGTIYDKEGLELFSRHNKKYAKTGSSFTIWYEHNGVANDGEYRIFIRRGRSGSWTELKIDTVSDYYQIRNVQTDIYVKIYGLNGYPVANEEISATDARAYSQANKIVVITPEPTDVQIISMAGAVVATDKVTGQREFGNLTAGIYIVRMGETVVKLQVRN